MEKFNGIQGMIFWVFLCIKLTQVSLMSKIEIINDKKFEVIYASTLLLTRQLSRKEKNRNFLTKIN